MATEHFVCKACDSGIPFVYYGYDNQIEIVCNKCGRHTRVCRTVEEAIQEWEEMNESDTAEDYGNFVAGSTGVCDCDWQFV